MERPIHPWPKGQGIPAALRIIVLARRVSPTFDFGPSWRPVYAGPERRSSDKDRRQITGRRKEGLLDVGLKGEAWRKYDPKKYPRDERIPRWVIEASHSRIVNTQALGDGINLLFRHVPGKGYYYYTTRRPPAPGLARIRRSSEKVIIARARNLKPKRNKGAPKE